MSDVKGLVLAKQDINEADALLKVLTDHGKIILKAKGVKKIQSKNARSCQLYTFSLFHLLEKNAKSTHLIQSAEIIQSYRLIREDLLLQTLACCMMEALDKSHSEEINLSLCIDYLNALQTSQAPYCVFALFLCYILEISGIAFWSDSCVLCGSSHHICAISIPDGGFVCQKCYHSLKHLRFSATKLKQIRMLCHASLDYLSILESKGPWEYDIVEALLVLLNLHGDFKLNGAAFLSRLNDLN